MSAPELAIARVEAGEVTAGSVADSPVIWWSFGKTVLAAAVLALVRDGKAHLDQAIGHNGCSLRALLQHTAGMPDYGCLPAYHESVASGATPWSDEEFISRTLAADAPRPKSGEFFYSNLGYLLIRQWIERTAGEELQLAIQRLLFEPMGIRGVRFAGTPDDLADTRWGNAGSYHPGWVGHGLLIGPPVSAALFLDRLIMGSTIPAQLLKEMRGAIVVGGPIEGRPFVQPSYGLGVMMDPKAPAGRMVGHTGQGPGSVAAVYRFPDVKPDCTIAVFGNSGTAEAAEWACVNAAIYR